MRIRILGSGTSSGIPLVGSDDPVCRSSDYRDHRLRVSALFEVDGRRILIDAGPDFREQMLRENIDHVDTLLLTHGHKDHTGGLDELRAFNFKTRKALPVYADQKTLADVKGQYHYLFAEERYPGTASLDTHEIDKEKFQVAGIVVLPVEVFHGDMPIRGFRIGNAAYLTDVKRIDPSEVSKLKDLDVLIVNAIRHETHWSHFNLEEALAFIEMIQPKKTFLSHISYKLGFHAAVSATLPKNVHLAYDGLRIKI